VKSAGRKSLLTERSYGVSVSEQSGRREAQKARTRATIRSVAHRAFAASGFDAVTIADIAAAAGVSVQTVFNHFASKEELFFADRTPWVEGPAAAVRDRAPGVPPKTALRRHLVAAVEEYARASFDPHVQRMIEVLDATPALVTFERNLHEETVAKLAAELAHAWGANDDDADGTCRTVLAEVTASVWMAAVRSVVVDLRSRHRSMDEDTLRQAVELIDGVLADLDSGLSISARAG
jgi:AcrR family transcriptional regulator